MSYRFELNTPDGRAVSSVISKYPDQETPLTVGSQIAARLTDLRAGEPQIRAELRSLYPQETIEVHVVNTATDELVDVAIVVREPETDDDGPEITLDSPPCQLHHREA